jgi:hypothetical protein
MRHGSEWSRLSSFSVLSDDSQSVSQSLIYIEVVVVVSVNFFVFE